MASLQDLWLRTGLAIAELVEHVHQKAAESQTIQKRTPLKGGQHPPPPPPGGWGGACAPLAFRCLLEEEEKKEGRKCLKEEKATSLSERVVLSGLVWCIQAAAPGGLAVLIPPLPATGGLQFAEFRLS